MRELSLVEREEISDGVASDPTPEVLASRLDQDAMIVTARIWYLSSMTSNSEPVDSEPVGAAILAIRTALDKAGIELGGATTGLDIVRESGVPAIPSNADDTEAA